MCEFGALNRNLKHPVALWAFTMLFSGSILKQYRWSLCCYFREIRQAAFDSSFNFLTSLSITNPSRLPDPAAELWNSPCWTPAWCLSSRQFVSCLGAGESWRGWRGGQHWIRLLIASLRGLLLRARYSVLLCCRRQSGIRVSTQHVVNVWDFCSSRLGIQNREKRATCMRSYWKSVQSIAAVDICSYIFSFF